MGRDSNHAGLAGFMRFGNSLRHQAAEKMLAAMPPRSRKIGMEPSYLRIAASMKREQSSGVSFS